LELLQAVPYDDEIEGPAICSLSQMMTNPAPLSDTTCGRCWKPAVLLSASPSFRVVGGRGDSRRSQEPSPMRPIRPNVPVASAKSCLRDRIRSLTDTEIAEL
jgi:hypothetical protein